MTLQSPADSSKGKAKLIRNARRLLILSPSSQSQSFIPSLLKQLTGHPPSDTQIQTQSFAGYTTHPPLRIENRYYAADVPVWVDEIPVFVGTDVSANGEQVSESESTGKEVLVSEAEQRTGEGVGRKDACAQWSQEFSSPEARVVRDAIGAVMICLRNPRPNAEPPASTSGGKGTGIPGDDSEDSDEVRGLKAFVRAVGTVRTLIEEERGEIGSVPGILVLGGKKEKKEEKPKAGGTRKDGLELDPNLGAGLDGELDEPFSIGWWEGQLCEMGLIGFEVVEWDWSRIQEGEERNQYGELQGMRRIKEVLETHEWAGDEEGEVDTSLPDDGDDLERELLGLDEEAASGFKNEVDELQREMVGLRFAIGRGGDGNVDDEEGDEELRVDAVEALLTRMRAIKDMSAELPEKERKRFAAKAVADIMKEI
ncbi:adaptin-binding domain-containing protein [Aspergillus foveolatus]|uniref:adaptin-binding domain-containing protein n=1 Tax=Aspergillus foveolatus TaxID=210207 RepID=UPI003CCCD710